MKHIFLLLLLIDFTSFGQDKNISVISLEKVNIVYRGITNPIKIAVPGVKSFKAEASGKLEKVDSLGNYLWNVTAVSGLKANIKITATMPDDSVIHEEKEFEIREINPTAGTLNGKTFNQKSFGLTRNQIANSTISLKTDNFVFNMMKLKVKGFQVYFPNQEPSIVYGNKFDTSAANKLEEVKNGEHIIIRPIAEYHVKFEPIHITVIEEDIMPKPIISLKNQNFIYRGVENELEIAVPEAKSFKVTALGLSEYGSGRYKWNVRDITDNTATLDFEIVTPKDSLIYDKKGFYIKDIPKLTATLNKRGCENCIVELSKSELKDAKIGVSYDFYADMKIHPMTVKEYNLILPEGYEYKVYKNTFSESAQKIIAQYPVGTIFKIKDIIYSFHGYGAPAVELKFILIE